MPRKKSANTSPAQPPGRHKTKNFTELIYGARVTFEDARQLDDYARKNRLSRSAAVRLALHQFALQQQLRYRRKDPAQVLQEQLLAEQLAPLAARLEELSALLAGPGAAVFETPPPARAKPASGPRSGGPPGPLRAAASGPPRQSPQILLEKVLAIVSLILRLQVNFLVAPVLGQIIEDNPAALAVYLADSVSGCEAWDQETRALLERTEQRILEELADEGWLTALPPANC